MENVSWAIMIVWIFLTVAGKVWDDTNFKSSGAVIGFVLMAAVYDDSFIFAVGLFVVNAYLLWTAIMAEI